MTWLTWTKVTRMSKRRVFQNTIAFERGNLVLAVVTLLVGGYLGHLLPPLVKDPLNPTHWPLWLLVAACVLLVIGIGGFIAVAGRHKAESAAAVDAITDQVEEMEKSNAAIFSLVERTIARQADLIPRDIIYREMAQAFNEADSHISVVTLLAVDWESGERTFAPALTETPFRSEFYDAIKKAIEREDVVYERIWQVPREKAGEALEALFTDTVHKEEFDLIEGYRKTNPHLAKFMLAPILTTASFILIDGKKLFFNFDIYDEETGKLESPYMLFVKDASGSAFEPLKGLIARFKPLTLEQDKAK